MVNTKIIAEKHFCNILLHIENLTEKTLYLLGTVIFLNIRKMVW